MKQIDANTIYSGAEVRDLLGTTLSEQVTGLALCKDHYFGTTLIEYCKQVGTAKIAKVLAIQKDCQQTTDRKTLSASGRVQKKVRERKEQNHAAKDGL